MTVREYLQKSMKNYEHIGDDFPNYSPKQEKYYGIMTGYKYMLEKFSDNILDMEMEFKRRDS